MPLSSVALSRIRPDDLARLISGGVIQGKSKVGIVSPH